MPFKCPADFFIILVYYYAAMYTGSRNDCHPLCQLKQVLPFHGHRVSAKGTPIIANSQISMDSAYGCTLLVGGVLHERFGVFASSAASTPTQKIEPRQRKAIGSGRGVKEDMIKT